MCNVWTGRRSRGYGGQDRDGKYKSAGCRIDLFLVRTLEALPALVVDCFAELRSLQVSKALEPAVQDTFHCREVLGSDHAPVGLRLQLASLP